MTGWTPLYGPKPTTHLAIRGEQLSLCQRSNVVLGREPGVYDPEQVDCPECLALMAEGVAS